jgi:hypothetical protein
MLPIACCDTVAGWLLFGECAIAREESARRMISSGKKNLPSSSGRVTQERKTSNRRPSADSEWNKNATRKFA